MMIDLELLRTSCFEDLTQLHFLVVKDFNSIAISTKGTPFFFMLVICAEVRNLAFFEMAIGCLLGAIVPFYRSIAVACHKVVGTLGFPANCSRRVPAQSRSVPYLQDFALVDVVYLYFSVGTPYCCDFVVSVDFESEYFCADISEEIDEANVEEGRVLDFNLSWLIFLVLLDCLFVHEYGFHFLEGDGPFEAAFLVHLHYIFDDEN